MTIEDIEKLAEEKANEYNQRGVSPFPFENIQSNNVDLKIFLTNKLPEDVSGLITYQKEEKIFQIVINKDKSLTRQQFTIAHEIGHYFLHKNELRSKDGVIDDEDTLDGSNILYRVDSGLTDQQEREANRFAAALLMPQKLVVNVWKELPSVEDCAKVFNVSVLAMTIRLQKLGLLG